ncbi:MAG: alpha/beta hydrolase [Actinomycetota bacterium]
MTATTLSADGTRIAFDVVGSGPAVVLVGGAFSTRQSHAGLAQALSKRFTVYVHDRRGRGDSGDTLPYSVDRELEDLAAVIDAAGGTALVYGHSSGAILSLLAAAQQLPITRVVAYEPPFTFDPAAPPHASVLPKVRAALAVDDRETAAELFMSETGMTPAAIDQAKQQPFWPAMLDIAPTAEYDLTIVGDGRVPSALLAAVDIPALVIDGLLSPPWAARAADAAAAAIPGARRLGMEGQHHGVDQAVLAPVLAEFFLG